MLVFRNEIRTQLNHRSAIHNAVEVGTNLMVCVAQDFCKGKAVEEPALVKKLLELSDSKTEHLPSLLPLVPGMPVIITQNIAIELGLINGMNGIFRQLVYDLDSVSTDSLSKTFPRRALPLVPAYSITTHKSQGQTLNKVVIDLKLPKDTDDIAAVYVPLSRVKRSSDLVILRHFDYEVLLIKPSKSQVAEMQRLDKLYIEAQVRFSEWF
ncbi:unnamed protein product [Adineta ricciae]|uniref:UvrD-like helicase C-terminal domain-containing protein n=1 Tax=Adineta ricciae TaxID=249248 RepID=A0A815WCG6_ADIRI|nr:unnamed protein product [Adineta ricciae]